MAQAESWPHPSNLAFVEELYVRWLRDPRSVDADWGKYFATLPTERAFAAEPRLGATAPSGSIFRSYGSNGHGSAHLAPSAAPDQSIQILQDRVDQLIRAYRLRGHLIAAVDPLGLPRPFQRELDPAFYKLTDADLDRVFSSETIALEGELTLRRILRRLQSTYCRSIGVQFMHITDYGVKAWLQARMEHSENRIVLGRHEQLRILRRLTDAVIFEEFIQKRFQGAKSFSLEGSESLIPLLDLAIEHAGDLGVEQIVIGMSHRGRLNVLSNIMGKSAAEIFAEFEDTNPELSLGRGDVKYHLGYSSDWKTTAGRSVHLSLCFNPSHLEFVGPVVQGRVRAKLDRMGGDDPASRALGIVIHGDAAFAGEGVAQEMLNMSRLEPYSIGGTIHVIVNNQIGFTTPPHQARSSTYPTGVARMLHSPIFHVNGEDPEAVAQVVRLALDFRQRFRRDVFIDMYGYRRRGHNEGDEPSFTQPLLYKAIEARKPVREGYLDHLLRLEGVTREEADALAARRREHLEQELKRAQSAKVFPTDAPMGGVWRGYCGGNELEVDEIDTGVPRERLARLLEIQTRLPGGFHPHPKIAKILETRREMAAGKRPLDWSAGENLALATLAIEGVRIRLTGQDAERGTFSHRHAVLHDFEDGHTYMPLAHLAPEQAPVDIDNSPLAEIAPLAFEYGYSMDRPEALVMWEAQFGDFVNVAQVIIDQFLTSAEDKWRRLSGLALLLPHGLEGAGPEHSSARIERFLSLAAEDNIQVAQPTTPAQIFHLLRRQVLRPWRKPLVVMTPKSLLRLPAASSSLDDLTTGTYQRVIADARPAAQQKKTERVLLCTGKLYYELDKKRTELERDDVAILRLEQLAPFPGETLRRSLAEYRAETPVFWVQEEPENMGAWAHLRVRFLERMFDRHPFAGISRPASASPATGSHASHKLEQEALLAEAFGL